MRTIITLPSTVPSKILVSVGDEISVDTTLAEHDHIGVVRHIPVAKLLGISPSHIQSNLSKHVGDVVTAGEVLAKRKKFLSSVSIKSPVSGKIGSIDLKKGTVEIVTVQSHKQQVKSPVMGKIVHITSDSIEVELRGQVYKSFEASGSEGIATLVVYPHEKLTMFDVTHEIEQCAILCKEITEDAAYKLEAMGAGFLITHKHLKDPRVPWMMVDDDVYVKLSRHHGSKVWLRPEQKEIVILSE